MKNTNDKLLDDTKTLKSWFRQKIYNGAGKIHGRKLFSEKSKNTEEYQLFEFYMNLFNLARPNDLAVLVESDTLSQPKCVNCSAPLRTSTARYCGAKCAQTSDEVKAKKKAAYEASGGTWSFTTPSAIQRTKETNLAKFGVENIRYNTDYIQSKILELHGVKSTAMLPETKAKRAATCLERYGTLTPSSHESVRQKISQVKLSYTDQEKRDINQRRNNTNVDRYGTPHPSTLPENRQKAWRTKSIGYYDTFIFLLEAKKITLLSSRDQYISKTAEDPLSYKCERCSKLFETKQTSPQRIVCPTCAETAWVSSGEQDLVTWLRSLGIEVETTCRKIIKGELDVFLPEYNIAIEYNGLYYHSDLFKDRNEHLRKTLECQDKGIQLIHIFENEWLYKQPIVKSIIKSKLNKSDTRLMARKCKVQHITNEEFIHFLNANHIQGEVNCKHRYALMFEDNIVAVAGFSRSRFHRAEIELVRYCSMIDTNVIGGLSKIVKTFMRETDTDAITSYVDRRYFTGSGYASCGFEYVSTSPPNYFYWKGRGDVLFSRHAFQKHKLESILPIYDPTLSERDNMIRNKYYRIYDCGNLKFRLTAR